MSSRQVLRTASAIIREPSPWPRNMGSAMRQSSSTAPSGRSTVASNSARSSGWSRIVER